MFKIKFFFAFLLFATSLNAQCWDKVYCGSMHTIVLNQNKEVRTWGDNSNGQLGTWQVGDSPNPVKIDSDSTLFWNKIDSDGNNVVGILDNGTLWSWGLNNNGQLGSGQSQYFQATPTQIGYEKDWHFVSMGVHHALALKEDNSLWGWGRNYEAEMGTLIKGFFNAPIQIGSEQNWITVSAGNNFGIAIKSDSTLWGLSLAFYANKWDPNLNYPPIKLDSTHNWKSIAAGWGHFLAIQHDGSLWAWGENHFGETGIPSPVEGDSIPNVSPLNSGNDWKMVSAGRNYSLGLKTNGTLWAWGRNDEGQLGIGLKGNNVPHPVQIGQDTDWTQISAGLLHAMALKSDGTLWAWGDNTYGQLGTGDYINHAAPIQLKCPETMNAEPFIPNNSFNIYPNITTQLINISIEENRNTKTHYLILNGQGVVVFPTQTLNPENVIDVSSLVPGVYFLQLQLGDQRLTRKFVKI